MRQATSPQAKRKVAVIAQNYTVDPPNKERRRKSIHKGAVFDAFKGNGTGECRRTILVRLFTDVLPVRYRGRLPEFQGERDLAGNRRWGFYVF